MATSNFVYLTNTGVIQSQTQDIQNEIIDEFKTAFGADLITDPSTPQGALIVAETIARTAVINNNAQLANQINPNEAGGLFLDGLAALTGLFRSVQTSSQVTWTLSGQPGTFVPPGITAQDANGNLYQNSTSATLSVSGTVTCTAFAVNAGPIITPASSAWSIISGVLGLETITNSAASTPGTVTQSDQSFRRQRVNTLALQGISLPEAIKSALYALDPSVNLSFRENVAPTTQTIDGIVMTAKSVYACVSDAGFVAAGNVPIISDVQVATVLLSKKSGGCAWNNTGGSGARSIDVVDPTSGQTYTVLFDRPTLVPVLIRVTISAATAPGNAAQIVTQAIQQYINGQLNNEPGFAVGEDVSCFELAGAVNQIAPNIYVINVETTLASSPGSWSNAPIIIALNQQATLGGAVVVVIE